MLLFFKNTSARLLLVMACAVFMGFSGAQTKPVERIFNYRTFKCVRVGGMRQGVFGLFGGGGLSDGKRRRHAETARETRHGLVAVLFFVSRRSVLLSRSPPASREFIRFESLLRYRVFYAFHLCRDRTALKKYGRAVIIRERISNRVSQSVCVPQSMPWREPITLLVINLNLRLKRPFFYLSP